MDAKPKTPKSTTNGMQGEDFNYGGAGSESDARTPAVVAGEVKKPESVADEQPAVKGTTKDPNWGSRNAGHQVPGGLQKVESAGKKSSSQE